MKLDQCEAEFLYRLIGRIDIMQIPIQHFLVAIILYEKLRQTLVGSKGGC